MSAWLKDLVVYILIVSVAMQMLPDKKYEQYLRLFTGFLLIVLVLQPILKIGSADSYLENKIYEFIREQEMLEEQIEIQGQIFEQKSENTQEENENKIVISEIEEVRVEVGTDD